MAGFGGLQVGCCGLPLSLVRYAAVFSVVEVQLTFYQPPRPATLEKWRSQVPEDFEFTLKAWQLITHEGSSPTYRRWREKLSEQQRRESGSFRVNTTVTAAWQRTLACAGILRSHRILFQCPAGFAPTQENKNHLGSFYRKVSRDTRQRDDDGALTFLWEPRRDWRAEEIKELCAELGLVHAVDPFQQRPVTSGLGYFRLHGRTGYRYRFTDEDLKELLDLTRAHDPCYVLFNNIAMPEDARRFLRCASRAKA